MALSETNSNPSILIHQVVNELLDSLQPRLLAMRIELETDLDSVQANSDRKSVESAIEGLLDNAIQSMPDGGDLSVTLVNGTEQWELEIADNSIVPASPLPSSAPRSDSLKRAVRAADREGGEIQTWNCPLGGKAHVLVVPRTSGA